MSNAPSLADLLKGFLKRCHRTPAALAELTGIPERTIENWCDGTVKKPRRADTLQCVLLLAAHLPLERADTTRLLRAAGQPPLDTLVVQAQRDHNAALLALLAPWLPAAPQPDPAKTSFEQRYRNTLLNGKLDRLEVFGIPVADDAAKQQRLSVAYVTLQAERPGQRESDFEEMLDSHAMLMRRMGELKQRTITGDVDQVLAPVQRALITAHAGAGKTTLVRWLTARAAAGDLPASMAAWHDTVPFYIRLRDLHRADGATQPFPEPAAFPLLEASVLRGSVPSGWVEELLANGRALVLIDGVDELPQSQREAMLEWLRDLVAAYPDARYLLTSRPLRVNEQPWQEWEDWLDQQSFARIRLQDMGLPTIERFIDHWHQALAERSTPDEAAEILGLRGPLKALLRRRPALYALATTPLLCAMICALHHEQPNTLPDGRVELYKQCIEMLLRRDAHRKIAPDPALAELKLEHKYRLIQEFAFRLTREGELGMERAAAEAKFAHELKTMTLPPETTGAKVLWLFVERVRLLHEPAKDRIEFVHRSFQEFLTAQTMIEEGEIQTLLNHALDDRWRETIVLAAGRAKLKQANQLIGGLLELARSVPEEVAEDISETSRAQDQTKNRLSQPRARLLTLALACLETCLQLDDQLRADVLEGARPLFPPQTLEEARLLAAAGQAGIGYLSCQATMDAATAGACIHALALIGGEHALRKVREFLILVDLDQVCRALCDNWLYFDRETYLNEIICTLERLFLDSLPFVEECWRLTRASFLSLSPRENNTLHGIEYLQALKMLDLSGVSGVDLGPVGQLPGLTTLDLSGAKGVDLTPLCHLPVLQEVVFAGSDLLRDLSVLATLRGLRLEIWLQNAPFIREKLEQQGFRIDSMTKFDHGYIVQLQ